MSRIGKLPVTIPAKVEVTLDGQTITVKGPKGSMSQKFTSPVHIAVENGEVRVSPAGSSKLARSMYGTARSIISNMVQGVTEGFSKDVEVKGVGFRTAVQGKNINMHLGYSHPINHAIPEGVTVTAVENTKLKIEGVDKQKVGELAASLKSYYKPEPYKGKGVYIAGERYRTKEGKKAG